MVCLTTSAVFGKTQPDFPRITKKLQKKRTLDATNFFDRKEKGEDYDLTYKWRDYEGNEFSVSFVIPRKMVEDSEKEFGYSIQELKNYSEEQEELMNEDMEVYLRELAEKLISDSPYSRYVFVDKKEPFGFDLRLAVPISLYPNAMAEYKKIREILFAEKESYLQNIEESLKMKDRQYIKQKGFMYYGKKLGIDYVTCVEKNRPRLKCVVEDIRKRYNHLSFCRFLELLVSFTQSIRSGPHPYRDGEKLILEFWVPLKVLSQNYGDCDSKAVTFASLWSSFKKYPMVFIRVPNHSLIGLAVPVPGGEVLEINGIRYSLLEVCVEEQIPPGIISPYSLACLKKGQYEYQLIR